MTGRHDEGAPVRGVEDGDEQAASLAVETPTYLRREPLSFPTVDFGGLLDVESYLDFKAMVAISSSLLLWVALVHGVLAAGVRNGDLVWSSQPPRRLDPSLRIRSFVYALLIIASVWVLVAETGLLGLPTVPDRWSMSATFVVTAFLGVATIYNLGWGSTWERMLFAPITLLGAILAGWLTFT